MRYLTLTLIKSQLYVASTHFELTYRLQTQGYNDDLKYEIAMPNHSLTLVSLVCLCIGVEY